MCPDSPPASPPSIIPMFAGLSLVRPSPVRPPLPVCLSVCPSRRLGSFVTACRESLCVAATAKSVDGVRAASCPTVGKPAQPLAARAPSAPEPAPPVSRVVPCASDVLEVLAVKARTCASSPSVRLCCTGCGNRQGVSTSSSSAAGAEGTGERASTHHCPTRLTRRSTCFGMCPACFPCTNCA